MVIPQLLTPWDPVNECTYIVSEVSTKTKTTGSYITIDCRVYDPNINQYLLGTENTFDTIYFPFSADPSDLSVSWLPGYRYTYTLTFGVGYDSQGKDIPQLQPLQISVSITPWNEGPTAEGIAS